MANCSDASGVIRFPKEFVEKVFLNSKEEYVHFIEHFENTFGKTYDGVWLNDDENHDDFVPNNEFAVSFNGVGKWDFQNNLSWFNKTFCKEYPIDELLLDKSEKKIKENALLNRWKNNPELSIIFDYADMEPGCEYLAEVVTEINYKNIQNEEINDLDYTKENIVSLGFYDKYECVDIKEIDYETYKYYLEKWNFTIPEEKLEDSYNYFIDAYGESRFVLNDDFYDFLFQTEQQYVD